MLPFVLRMTLPCLWQGALGECRAALPCPLGQGTLCFWRALSGLCGVIVYSGFENPRRHPGERGMAYAALYFYPYGLFSAFGGATLGAAQTCLRT